jgi:hypothetical protein
MSYPDGNPKTLLGAAKVPLGLVSPVAMAHEAKALALGEKKYGPANWRKDAVSSSVYFNAALRHIYQWWEGQDIDPESAAHHLGHARACLGILLDAASVGKLNDNRPSKGNLEEVLEALRVKPQEAPAKTSSYRYEGSKTQLKGLVFKLRVSPGLPHRMVHSSRPHDYSIAVRQGPSAWDAVAGHGYFYAVDEA